MPPLPKRKLSKARKGRRRSHDALQLAQLVRCSNCGAMRRAHEVCPECGHYKGETVIEAKAAKKD